MILDCCVVGPLQCNCCIVGDEKTSQAIVIDPGDDVEQILQLLQKHRLSPALIVATHAHIDHVAALADLKRRTGAKALLHEADLPLYEQLARQAEWLGVPAPTQTHMDSFLTDGKRLDFDHAEVRVAHTPGHSPGSVSFILNQKTPIVFSGDTLFAGSVGRTDLWGGSFPELLQSIQRKLLSLPDDTIVLPGHGPQTTIGEERRTNPFLQSLQ